MTKEETLIKNIGLIPFVSLGENKGLPILHAMDEYAKDVAIDFMAWNSFLYTEGIDIQKGHWFNHKGECMASSNEQLYNIYLQSKQK